MGVESQVSLQCMTRVVNAYVVGVKLGARASNDRRGEEERDSK